METSTNLPPATATDEPAVPTTLANPPVPLARISDRLTEPLFGPARDAGRDLRPGRVMRADGWTPERITNFLNVLAQSGVVADAARAAGMSKKSAYALRNSAKGRAFLLAWRAALLLARRHLADEAMSRAMKGSIELIFRDGKLWEERHRYDSRLTMAVLGRLDRLATAIDKVEGPVRIVAEEFEQFVGIASRGGEGAAEFLGERLRLSQRFGDEADLLERSENYRRFGDGLASELQAFDLDPEPADRMDEQAEGASGSGLLDDPAEKREATGDRSDPGRGDPA